MSDRIVSFRDLTKQCDDHPIGFNIERDYALRKYDAHVHTHPHSDTENESYCTPKWVNGVVVLDNPNKDHPIDWTELNKKMAEKQKDSDRWIRKEEMLGEYGYNVEQIDSLWLWIIANIVHILGYDDTKEYKSRTIVVQTHRGNQGILQNHYIRHQLESFYCGFEDESQKCIRFSVKYETDSSSGKTKKLLNPEPLVVGNELVGLQNVTIIFDNGYWPDCMKHRDNIDFHISISLCGGLDPSANPGTFIIPDRFSKLDVTSMEAANEDCPEPFIYSYSSDTNLRNWLVENFSNFNQHLFEKCAEICWYNTISVDVKCPIPRIGTIATVDRLIESIHSDQKVIIRY